MVNLPWAFAIPWWCAEFIHSFAAFATEETSHRVANLATWKRVEGLR
jgi:hypothetical protein